MYQEIVATCQAFPTFSPEDVKWKQGYVVALEYVLKDLVSKETNDN